jgi:hypothetical protein
MYKKEMLKLLKANVGKGVSFYLGSTYMSPYKDNWYILPFTNDDLLRVVSLDSDKKAWVTDPDTVITDTTFKPKNIMTFSITHFRIDQLVGVTIF